MRVSYEKDQRKEAMKTGKRLYTFQITGPFGKGGITVQGLVTPETAPEMLEEIKHYADLTAKVL